MEIIENKIARVGDNIFFEESLSENGKIIRIYFKKWKKGYVQKPKCYATHYLEQVLDEENNVISEIIKENPHKIEINF